MGAPDRSLGAAVASLSKKWLTLVTFIYLVLIPAGIVYVAVQANHGLGNDDRQDRILKAQIAKHQRLTRQNCERSSALLNYLIATSDDQVRLRRLILDFDRIGDCPQHP